MRDWQQFTRSLIIIHFSSLAHSKHVKQDLRFDVASDHKTCFLGGFSSIVLRNLMQEIFAKVNDFKLSSIFRIKLFLDTPRLFKLQQDR